MSRACAAPEVRLALQEWQSKERTLRERIEQRKVAHREAIDTLDIEVGIVNSWFVAVLWLFCGCFVAVLWLFCVWFVSGLWLICGWFVSSSCWQASEQLDAKQCELDQQLWQLVQCKLDKSNQNTTAAQEHYSLVYEGQHIRQSVDEAQKQHSMVLDQCDADKQALVQFTEQQQSFQKELGAVVTHHESHLAGARSKVKTERNKAEQQVKSALRRLVRAYNCKEKLKCATEEMQQSATDSSKTLERNKQCFAAAKVAHGCCGGYRAGEGGLQDE